MNATRHASLAFLLLLTGCTDAPPETPAFDPVADVKQVMSAVLEPAAEVYWDAVGWIIDGSGTLAIEPATGEEWEAVRNAAFVVAESGNLLMMEGRAVLDGNWNTLSRALVEVGRRAIAAAEARDPAAVFEVGGEIYEACTACHALHATATLRPSDSQR